MDVLVEGRRPRGRKRRWVVRVLMLLAVLAAIAWSFLPNFDDGRGRATDSAAKTDARNLVSMVEACFIETRDYGECEGPAGLGTNTGLTFGPEAGQVTIVAHSKRSYTITAHSTSGNTFAITKINSNTVSRWCEAKVVRGCPASGAW